MDEQTTTEIPDEPPVTGEVPGAGPTELREAYNRTRTENQKLQGEIMGIRLGEIGLAADTGLGKAIAKEYKGDLSTEAIAEYARNEYGHDGSVAAPNPALSAAERIDAIGGAAQPLNPPPTPDEQQREQLQQLAAAGDEKAQIALALQAQGSI